MYKRRNHLKKLLKAGWGVQIFSKYHGYYIVVSRPDQGSYIFERWSIKACFEAAYMALAVAPHA